MKKIGVINSLRGIAILMVIYQHLLAIRVLNRIGNTPENAIIFGGGLFGVVLFFILSGFVLYRPYLLEERSFKTWKDVLSFYRHRFFRIYPLLIMSCLIISIFGQNMNPEYLKSTVLAATTMSMYTYDNFFPLVNTVLWSLSIEIWFSIAFPLIVVLIKRFGIWRILAGTLVLSTLVRLLGYNMVFLNHHVNPIKDHFLGRIDDMVVGMVIAYLFYKRPKIVATQTVLGLVFGIGLFFLGNFIWQFTIPGEIPEILEVFTNNIFQLSFFLITIFLLRDTIISKILRFWPLQYLGIICYSLYVWHAWMIYYTIDHDSSLKGFGIYTIALLVFASASYFFIERRGKG